jgi:hypothetical protein
MRPSIEQNMFSNECRIAQEKDHATKVEIKNRCRLMSHLLIPAKNIPKTNAAWSMVENRSCKLTRYNSFCKNAQIPENMEQSCCTVPDIITKQNCGVPLNTVTNGKGMF